MTSAPKDNFTGNELSKLTAVEVVELLKKREVSSKELLDLSFSRMEQVEPDINATPIQCRERADNAALSLNMENQDHPAWLAGLPINIKDLTRVEGVLKTEGTLGRANNIAPSSDVLVVRLEERGGVVVGKTNTPEMGAGGNTFNDVFGATLNPWNTYLNAGGSSGGAAASLATGEVWLAHGSDHGGSLRTPAAYCGIVGLRPSPGRAGGAGPSAGFLTEGVQGPMARTVEDCALFLDAMAGYIPQQPISFPAPQVPFLESVRQVKDTCRIAFSPDLNGFFPVDREMADHLAGAMKQIAGAGAVVEEVLLQLPELARTYHTLRGIMWAAEFKHEPDEITKHFKSVLRENLEFGQRLTLDDVVDAHLNRTIIFNKMLTVFESFDVLACPVVGNMPRLQTEEWVREVGGVKLEGYMDWLRPAFLATTTGLPAMSVPVGLGPGHIPVGIQLIGPPRGEAMLLQAARFVERVMGDTGTPIDPVSA